MALVAVATFMIVSIGVNTTPIAVPKDGHTEIATTTESMVGTVTTAATPTVIMPIRPGTMPLVGPTARREAGTGTTDRVTRDRQQSALTAHHAATTAMPVALGIMDDREVIGDKHIADVLAAIGRRALTAPIETTVGQEADHLVDRKDLRTAALTVDLRIGIAVTTTDLDRPGHKPIADDRAAQTVARPIRTGAMMTIDRGGQWSAAAAAMGPTPDKCPGV